MIGFRIVDLKGNTICYFKSKVEAEKFIQELGLVNEFRIEEVNLEKRIDEVRKRIKYLINYYINLLDWIENDK